MQRFKLKGVLGRWVWSYAIVLLIPVLLMAAAYHQTRWVIEDEIYRANSALLTQLQQEIDNYVDFTHRLTDFISLNAKLTSIIRNQENIGQADRMLTVETLADFRAYNISRRYVDHFYIYFHTGDFILTDSAYYETTLYYNIFNNKEIPIEDWKQNLTGIYRSQFMSKQQFNGETGIMYAQTLPIYHSSPTLATLIVELNEERLMQSIRTIQSFNEGKVYILGDNNQLLASSEQTTEEPSFLRLHLFEDKMGAIPAKWDDEDVMISYTTSEHTNWKYVYVLPTRLYSEKAQYTRNVTLVLLGIALVLGSIIAILLAKRNYNPLQRLVRSVAERSKLLPGYQPRIDEFDYLETVIEKALDHNSVMSATLEKQKKTLFSNLLVRLLKGRVENSFPLAEVLPEYGVEVYSDRFAVMLFYLEDFSEFFKGNDYDEEKNRKMVHLIMTNIVEELVGKEHQGWMTEIDEMFACIVNFKSEIEQKAALDYLKKTAEEAKQFIGTRFHITFTVSVSSVHGSAEELPIAYQEALNAMEYRMLLGPFKTIVWKEGLERQGMFYTYPLEKEQQLIGHVNAGDFSHAKQTLDEIIDTNLEQDNISIEMIRCLMFDMCSTMMKAAMEANLEHNELYEDNMETVQELISGSTVNLMRERMTLFLGKVCSYVEERNKSSKVILKDGVLTYIEENYQDYKLSVSNISEHFGVHPSYLSRYFREQTGETLADYISKYRVERSKELLLQDDILIKDVINRVGIYSVSTFIRMFKKFEGITPSAFRERNKE